MKENYIKAGLELIEAGTPVEIVLRNMKQVMAQKGHSSLYSATLRGMTKKLEAKDLNNIPTVVVSKSDSEALKGISSACALLGSETSDYTVVVDPTIVGGSIVTYNYQMIDQCHKTKLKNLYQSIVSKNN